jgi:hypothetical protein
MALGARSFTRKVTQLKRVYKKKAKLTLISTFSKKAYGERKILSTCEDGSLQLVKGLELTTIHFMQTFN